MNVLCVGNSFSRDTVHHVGEIAKSAGMTEFCFANLYIGGCSVKRHYRNAVENLAEYHYTFHAGNGWEGNEPISILDALRKRPWDIVSIQHGTGDKSRYTSEESYSDLAALISYLKENCPSPVKIAFNMAWVGEPDRNHHEIASYGGDVEKMYRNLTKLTRDTVAPLVDFVSPTGTAIQNLRTCVEKKLTRDGFHLSYDLGRYTAGLTFLKTLCDTDLARIEWAPEGVSAEEKALAIQAVRFALQNPYECTDLKKTIR